MADKLREKLVRLAERVEGRQISHLEGIRIELRAERIEGATRDKVRKLIAESLSKSESDVIVKLASYDDSNRILDDIVNTLNDDEG